MTQFIRKSSEISISIVRSQIPKLRKWVERCSKKLYSTRV